jgi:hypothetical protein
MPNLQKVYKDKDIPFRIAISHEHLSQSIFKDQVAASSLVLKKKKTHFINDPFEGQGATESLNKSAS